MRAVVVRGSGQYRVEEVPEPDYREYEALVRISHCGICGGTDRHIVQGTFPSSDPYLTILDDESIGQDGGLRQQGPLREDNLVSRPMTKSQGDSSTTFGSMAELGVVNDARAIVEDALPRAQPRPMPLCYQQVVPPSFDPTGVGTFITFKETLSWAQDFAVGPGTCHPPAFPILL